MNNVLHPFWPYPSLCDILAVEYSIILCSEELITLPAERKKVLPSNSWNHLGITKCQYHAQQYVYLPGINSDIKCRVETCIACQCHHLENPQQLIQQIPAPEYPWQLLGADFFHFDGSEYLTVSDCYSKMLIIHRIPALQCNPAKMISIMQELSAENGIQESLCTDNGPQFANALFVEFSTYWKFDHNPSAPRKPRSNCQAVAAVKIVKELPTCTKCSSLDAYLAHHRKPINVHLCFPAEFQFHDTLHTTVPQCIWSTDPHAVADHDCLNECASQSATYHDCWGCRKYSHSLLDRKYSHSLLDRKYSHSLLDRLSLSSMMLGICVFLTLSSVKPAMAHT